MAVIFSSRRLRWTNGDMGLIPSFTSEYFIYLLALMFSMKYPVEYQIPPRPFGSTCVVDQTEVRPACSNTELHSSDNNAVWNFLYRILMLPVFATYQSWKGSIKWLEVRLKDDNKMKCKYIFAVIHIIVREMRQLWTYVPTDYKFDNRKNRLYFRALCPQNMPKNI